MATSNELDIQLAAGAAAGISLTNDPSIWSMAILIPVSLYICANQSITLGPVLACRLLVILSMNFVQKEAVMAFPCWFLLGYQMALQIVLIAAYNYNNLKVGKMSDLWKWLLYMTPFWVAQLITSLYAFKVTSVSTIQIIRSILPLMSFAMEKTLYNNPKTVSGALIASMVMVMIGTTIYGYSSASVTPIALMWIFTNSVFTVVATVFRSKFMKDKDFTVSTPLAMCSVSTSAIPFILVCGYLTGETEQWHHAMYDTPGTAWFFATISGLIAGCFSFLQFRCQKVISGTSDLMFQNFVKVFIIIMGIVAFADSFTYVSLSGCIIALGGCAWYGYVRQEGTAKKVAPSDLEKPLAQNGK